MEESDFELTPRVLRIIEAIFEEKDRNVVTDLLREECTPAKCWAEYIDAAELERIRLAILKSSNGDTDNLLAQLKLVQTDYRDVLVGAGFGSDGQAHNDWSRQLLSRAGNG